MFKTDFYDFIPKHTLQKLIASQPTPSYMYFSKILESKFKAIRETLPSQVRIHYALKANPHSQIITQLSNLGAGADVASQGELKIALDSGIAPENIEFSGPGKTEEELVYAIRKKIASINIESVAELEKIVSICTKLQEKAYIGVRINQHAKSLKAGLKMSGETQFGLPEHAIKNAFELIKRNSHCIEFTGIHVHTGSQILTADELCENFAGILDLAVQIENTGIVHINKINFGGGWGIPYFPNQHSLDLTRLREGLKILFAKPVYQQILKDAKLIVEPGRFLVGECGIYISRVLYSKKNTVKKFLILDGGMHHNYLLAGGMGQVIKRNFEMDVISTKGATGSMIKYDIAGRLCTPQDILASDFEYPGTINPEDYIIFFNVGAYGYTASPLLFLTHPQPCETVIP